MTIASDEYENITTIEAHELDYKRRLEPKEFTKGLTREQLI